MGTPSDRQREIYEFVTLTRKATSSHRCGARAHQTIALHLGNNTRRARRANRPIPSTLSPDRCPCWTPLPQTSRQPSSRSHASPRKNGQKRTTAVLTAAAAHAGELRRRLAAVLARAGLGMAADGAAVDLEIDPVGRIAAGLAGQAAPRLDAAKSRCAGISGRGTAVAWRASSRARAAPSCASDCDARACRRIEDRQPVRASARPRGPWSRSPRPRWRAP